MKLQAIPAGQVAAASAAWCVLAEQPLDTPIVRQIGRAPAFFIGWGGLSTDDVASTKA